jgi:2'-5' RNA ligase
MPEGNIKDQLKNTIYSLSTGFGGPIFEPHITLVSGFIGSEKELLQKTEIISKKIKPFEIIFGHITYLDNYFRSLFLTVKVSIELKLSRDIACKELNWNDNDYMPHLSLAYCDFNKKEKEKMVSTVDIMPNGFLVDNIFLAHNDEINLKWKIIRGFKLGI